MNENIKKQVWQKIGNKMQIITKNYRELSHLLYGLPLETYYEKEFNIAYKSWVTAQMYICKTFRKDFYEYPTRDDLYTFYCSNEDKNI
ncbi:MAG: hypothetical protein WCL13_00565 [bacterium]